MCQATRPRSATQTSFHHDIEQDLSEVELQRIEGGSCDCPCHILPPIFLHGICWCSENSGNGGKKPAQEYKEVP